MSLCPFCRRPVELQSVWCSCGENLSRFSSLPMLPEDILGWLENNASEVLNSPNLEGGLLQQAKSVIISDEEKEVASNTSVSTDVLKVRNLFGEFLQSCSEAGIAPNVDAGQLRRARWKQWRRAEKSQRINPPVKNFQQTPAYYVKFELAKYFEVFCLCLDGTLYKHYFNALDPFPVEELLKVFPLAKIEEGLRNALVFLLRQRQQAPSGGKTARF